MNRSYFTTVILLATVAIFSVSCGRGKITEYSAEMLHSDSKNKSSHVAKLFVTPQKIRVENPTPDKRGPGIVIIREDKGKMQIITPEKKTFFEIPMTKENNFGQLGRIPEGAEVKDLGKEKINGFQCRKKSVVSTVKTMMLKKTVSSTVWVSDRLEIPLKTVSGDGKVMELLNIKPGRQSKDIFEVPSDYTKSTFPKFFKTTKAHPPSS